MRCGLWVWILSKITILKAIHNYLYMDLRANKVWILSKITILKAIHNHLSSDWFFREGVNSE